MKTGRYTSNFTDKMLYLVNRYSFRWLLAQHVTVTNVLMDRFALRIKTKEGRDKETIIYLDNNVETQKWNHMVINYQSNTMDIFINNELVTTKFKSDMPYMSYDNIIVGEDNGIQGGICNVMYFKRSIPKRDISLIYYSSICLSDCF